MDSHPISVRDKEFPSPVLFLAPMEGLTNKHIRELIIQNGGVDVVATEFIRITNSKQTLQPIGRHGDFPLQIQLMASAPDTLAGAIYNLKQRGILQEDDWIDLNVGCPSRRVNAHGAGAALLQEPKKLLQMLRSMRAVHQHGILSMKTRLGFESSEDFSQLLKHLQDAPIDLITIHARTRCAGYDANHLELDKLSTAAHSLPYPVIGNGDIFSVEAARRMLATGVAGLMCGRGAMINPFIFKDIREALHTISQTLPEQKGRPLELLTFVIRYLNLLKRQEKLFPRKGQVGSFKEFATWFSRNPLIGPEFFSSIRRKTTLEEISEGLIAFTRMHEIPLPECLFENTNYS